VLSEEFIRAFQQHLFWANISSYQKLSEDFIAEFGHKIVWKNFFEKHTLSENFIRKHENAPWFNWNALCGNQKLSEKLIRDFQQNVNWRYIATRQVLSEEFIKEFKYTLDFREIVCHQTLSEEFITEFSERLDWDSVSEFQVLTDSIIANFNDKINWELYFYNRHSRFELLKKHIVKAGFKNTSEFSDAHLNEYEIQELQKIMDVRNIFKPKNTVPLISPKYK
jgi:hypothetical protein